MSPLRGPGLYLAFAVVVTLVTVWAVSSDDQPRPDQTEPAAAPAPPAGPEYATLLSWAATSSGAGRAQGPRLIGPTGVLKTLPECPPDRYLSNLVVSQRIVGYERGTTPTDELPWQDVVAITCALNVLAREGWTVVEGQAVRGGVLLRRAPGR